MATTSSISTRTNSSIDDGSQFSNLMSANYLNKHILDMVLLQHNCMFSSVVASVRTMMGTVKDLRAGSRRWVYNIATRDD